LQVSCHATPCHVRRSLCHRNSADRFAQTQDSICFCAQPSSSLPGFTRHRP
jgi:hypothetical protein